MVVKIPHKYELYPMDGQWRIIQTEIIALYANDYIMKNFATLKEAMDWITKEEGLK